MQMQIMKLDAFANIFELMREVSYSGDTIVGHHPVLGLVSFTTVCRMSGDGLFVRHEKS